MDGARTVFLSAGFDGASMNDIAREAGVSKGTLYAYFNSKDELFEAIIRGEYAQAAERLCVFRREGDVADMLTDFGVRLMRRMTRARHAGARPRRHRGGGKIPQRRPRILRSGPPLRRDPPRRGTRALESAGALKVPDPERAAWQFVDLCQSYVYKRLLFGVVDSLSARGDRGRGQAGVEVFLKAMRLKRSLKTGRGKPEFIYPVGFSHRLDASGPFL